MDRLQSMQIFARVVEMHSFTRAADSLVLPKSRVTRAVKDLEKFLGARLLQRTTRHISLTPEGTLYYERVVRLLADLEDADTHLASATASPKGRLRVDVPAPLARLILVPALPAFHARHPEIQLDLGVSDRVVDVIGDNVDCVLRGGELTDSSLVARRVGELRLGVYAAPGYLARAGRPVHPRELEGSRHRIVGFLRSRSGTLAPIALSRAGEQFVPQGRYAVALDDGNAYAAAGVAGMGVLWLPRYMAQPHLDSGELVPLFEDWAVASMPLYLVFPPNRHLSAKLRAFIDWVDELMAKHAPLAMSGGS